MTLELKMLALSIVLGLVQIVLASHAASLQREQFLELAKNGGGTRTALIGGWSWNYRNRKPFPTGSVPDR